MKMKHNVISGLHVHANTSRKFIMWFQWHKNMELKGFYIGIEIFSEKSILRILLDLRL